MPAILRIDVDRAYENRILHLESCKEVVNDLNNRGIKASLFFQPFTVPNKEFAQELMKGGHSVGLHTVHTKDYNDFSRDLNKISRRFDGKVYGFRKHDSGKFKLLRRLI
jgi:pyridoxine 5'-phosphate synthase PdxJ